jgi:N-acetylmuramoyl-L-alanine amidase
MPSVLVELGFISTPQEEQYLNSEAGSNTLANGIFRAFLAYKREHEIRMTGSSQTKKVEELPEEKVSPVLPDIPTSDLKAAEDSTQEIESKIVQPDVEQQKERTVSPRRNRNNIVSRQTNNDETVFKIQILTSSALIPANDKRLKGLAGVEYYQENGLYKYTYGPSTNYNAVLKIKREISSIFKDAFIIAFKNGEKVNINTAIAEFKKRKTSNKD